MAAAREKPSCLIKVLPTEMVGHAARIATDINPLNRPAVQMFAATFPGDETDVLPAQYIAALTTRYWGAQPRVIPVQFMDNPSQECRRLILGYANAWRCGITYVESETMGKVRLTRALAGYWSYLGTDILLIPPDQPTMCLHGFTERTAAAEYLRVVPHEFGHNNGFPHEHMRRELVARLDRERTISYFGRTQGWSRREVEAQVLTPLDESSLMGTPADKTSAMCYQLPGEITVDGRPIPGGAGPNPSDLAFARQIYPLGAGPVEPPSPPGPVEPVEPTSPEPAPDVKAIPLVLGKPSAPKLYRPKDGPLVYRVQIAKPGPYRATLQGVGRWMMSVAPDDPANGFHAETKGVEFDVFDPGPHYLTAYKVAKLSGQCRVKVAPGIPR